ncbi:hypothetical protein LAZ67_13001793 [Cordylochernes scorpioides]|uniref:Uncharacterized protein n=1 Tax=Cordylochernes scorpioides TaxID=51811 RepID=A0ABY6L7L4_9ARAC|nr:hypothetical protein LAZ67_13001793 [Cordylochernes scorpioides]
MEQKLKQRICIEISGRISIEDDPRQERPKCAKNHRFEKENPRTTLLELEQDTGISKTTIGRIVTKDLKLKKTPAKFIPRFLTNEQKLCRLATCENMLEMTRTDPEWKDKIITGDETWVYDYDPETKRQYAEWRGQEILPQPPYSPDIAPNDFFLFPKLEAVLKGRHFDTRDDIIEKSLLTLKSIPKELYKNCFDNLGKRWRWVFLVVAISAFGFLLVFMSYSGENVSGPKPPSILKRTTLQQNASVINTPGCRIPFWDPFDPSVNKFYKRKTEDYNCPGLPSFIRVLPHATLQVDQYILKNCYDVTPEHLNCSYQVIVRDAGPPSKPSDSKVTIGKSEILIFGVSLDTEFIYVHCFRENGERILTEFISLITNKTIVQEKQDQQKNNTFVTEPLNIIFLGIDSISKLNFYRHFPKTRKFLSETLKPIELHGYNKVGDNTFPNLTPLLTGQFVEYYWNESVRSSYFFDNLDFVWKLYSNRSYVTMLAEDSPNIATYNYLKPGFKEPPTDYYYRPMSIAMERSDMKKKSKPHCFNSKLEINVLFDYLRNFVHALHGSSLYFAFTFVARLTHDYVNNAGYADKPSLKILKDLHHSGVLNNSILFFYSDHGIRFGDIRKTYIGKFEERLPMAYLIFPPWFYEKYPDLYLNMKKNEHRLTTPFDIHATFVDYLKMVTGDASLMSQVDKGISLFKPIPDTRTCEEASILPHWCTCHVHMPVKKDDKNVVNAAQALVETVNDWLSGEEDCVHLDIDSILDARVGSPNDKVLTFVRHINDVINRHPVFGDKVHAPVDYLLTLRTKPGGALLEGTVRHDSLTDNFHVLDDVSRLDRYGNQSYCVDDSRLRKYCYCRGYQQLN